MLRRFPTAVVIALAASAVLADSGLAVKAPLLVLGGMTHLPAGAPGKVTIVAQDYTGEAYGANATPVIPNRGEMLLVLRNNTAKAVYDVRVTASVVGSNGTVYASKKDLGAQPIRVPPKGLAIDIVAFSANPVAAYPAGSRFQFSVSSGSESSAGYVDVPVQSGRLDAILGTISGVAKNTTSSMIDGPFEIFSACLDQHSALMAFGVGTVENYDSAAPGQQLTFTAQLTYSGGIKPGTVCKHALVSVVGSAD